jgi:hypothetical protein
MSATVTPPDGHQSLSMATRLRQIFIALGAERSLYQYINLAIVCAFVLDNLQFGPLWQLWLISFLALALNCFALWRSKMSDMDGSPGSSKWKPKPVHYHIIIGLLALLCVSIFYWRMHTSKSLVTSIEQTKTAVVQANEANESAKKAGAATQQLQEANRALQEENGKLRASIEQQAATIQRLSSEAASAIATPAPAPAPALPRARPNPMTQR